MMKKQSKSSSSLHIPQDIIVQVLARIPAKSLVRFMCVCKHWKSIICDPQFAGFHRTFSQTRMGGNYLVTLWYYKDEFTISFKDHDGRRKVPCPITIKLKERNYGCVHLNGILCLYHRYDVLVLNMSTRQIVQLPTPRFAFGRYFLGFDRLTGEYKVFGYYSEHKQCAIYSLGTTGTNSWRQITNPPESLMLQSHACINGSIYWLSAKKDSYEVVGFDVGREVFRILRLTEPVNYSTVICGVGNCLASVSRDYSNNEDGNRPEIWLLEESGDQILVKEKISFPASMGRINQLYVSGISPTGEIVLLDSRISREVYLDLKEKSFRKKRFKWPHPRKGDTDKRLRFRKSRYNLVENMYRFKEDNDNVRNCYGSFSIMES